MKRIISCLLAVVMALMSWMPAYLAQAAERNIADGQGQVDVTLVSALVMKKDCVFTVALSGQEKQEVTLKADNQEYPEKVGAAFEHLAPGTYTLTVSAPGFVDYQQDIVVVDQAYRLTLMTGFMAGYDYEAGVHPGVIFIGDVDSNGRIDDLDKKQITDTIDSGGYNAAADLNRDGHTDLSDLEYFTKSYQQSHSVQSAVEIGIPAVLATVSAAAGTRIDSNGGGIRSILAGTGTVGLSREDGADISKEHPVSIDIALQEGCSSIGGIVIETGADNLIQTAEVDVTGDTGTITVPIGASTHSVRALQAEAVEVKRTQSGTICIDLKSQVAVKRVTLRVTGMQKNLKLAEISKVTFIGDMASRIPEPASDIPQNIKAEPSSAAFTLTWSPCENVTGYEVWVIEKQGTENKQEEVIQVTGNTLSVATLAGNKLKNYTQYEVRVRSVNGTWRSAYSDPVTVEPRPDKKPDAPDNVRAVGKYKSILVSWKKVKEAVSYKLYYKKADDPSYAVIDAITGTSYTITGLEDWTKYICYVTGVNELGEGAASLSASAQTKDIELAKVPKYKLLNVSEGGMTSSHIISAAIGSGNMQDSAKDTAGTTAWGSIDRDPKSCYVLNSWDSGGYNTLGNHGLIYEFDQPYKMKMIALQELVEQDTRYGYAQIRYWNENNEPVLLGYDKVSIQKKSDVDGRVYYMLRLSEAITAKKIQIGLARVVASGTVTVSEVYFYHYDSLEDDIMALYTDDLHTVLRSDVTQSTIDKLRTRILTKDSGEYHPDKEMLERELKTAEDILNSKPASSVRIHSGITTKDVNRGFGGLNAWQPVGVTAAAGEAVTVYVGHHTKRTGENTDLQLVATQYHAESSPMSQVIGSLKIGRNDITVPKIWSTDAEAGGALYVQYTGAGVNDDYAVRISGGVEVPVLDLYQVKDESERMARITEYLTKLDRYVSQMSQNHAQIHMGGGNKNVNYPYNEKDCILGATDILLDTMMLSLPAPQVWKGVNGSGGAQTLSESMYAMEDMMHLFYQHKGLNNNAAEAVDRIPSQHLNIRYQRMFAGAFMYASGNHIGIEYNETAGMVNGKRVQADQDGKHQSGQYFGWGIAHEIGHCINQGSYAVAEVTNNYYSVLAQAKDTNDSVRFQYDDVYKKVTSNAKGPASNVFTQLGMYWQLHLAYDQGYNYKRYEDYNEQLGNLFFARVDHYARTPKDAPAPGGNTLVLTSNTDQNLMRLSCAAAQKNLLPFFERWGMVPDEATKTYAQQFEVETRAIYYVNDHVRVYQKTSGGQSKLQMDANGVGATSAVAAETNANVVQINGKPTNQVEIKLAAMNLPSEDILGYEIVRCTVSAASEEKENRELAGFVTANDASEVTFTDQVTTLNNRVITYEVTLIDKYLHRSAVKKLNPVKIMHEGLLDKTNWTLHTDNINATNVDRTVSGADENMCAVEEAFLKKALQKAIDKDHQTAYTGVVQANAAITIELNASHAVTGFKYTGTPINNYKLSVQDQNGGWIEVSTGAFMNGDLEGNTAVFAKETENISNANKNIAQYQTTALKLEIIGQAGTEISIKELDVLGIAGDNIEFYTTGTEQTPAVGRLKEAYIGTDGAEVISKGAIVFAGTFRGNPAYNVVMLFDDAGNLIGGRGADGTLNAEQLIFADVPNDGNIQTVSDGTWFYIIDPADLPDLPENGTIRAELYRVDNASTNEGQRLVSDTLPIKIPDIENLPDITITKAETKAGAMP